MSDELERELRDMLATRGGDVRSVPDRLLILGAAAPHTDPDAEVLDLGLRRADVLRGIRKQWPLLLAAATVAAVLAGVLLALPGGSSSHDVPPATRSTGAAKPVPTLQRTTCAVADPSRWNAAVRAASSELQGTDPSQGVLGDETALPNGDLLVAYNRRDDPHGTIGSDVGILSPGSDIPRKLAYFGVRTSGGARSFTLDVEVDNLTRTAVVSVETARVNQTDSVSAIYSLDTDTGRRTQLMSASDYPARTHLSQGYVHDSTVYWEADPLKVGRTTSVYAVPVSGGTPRVVVRGSDVLLDQSALGITWNIYDDAVERPADVPAVVARQGRASFTDDTFDSFVTDGSSYAWATDNGALLWYSPDAGHIVSFRGLLGRAGRTQSFINAVAGPLVFFQTRSGKSQAILDTRTGALVPITSGGSMVGTPDGTAVGDPLLDGPHSGDAGTVGRVMRLDTSSLPPVAC